MLLMKTDGNNQSKKSISHNQSTNQSISQSINQSIKPSIDESQVSGSPVSLTSVLEPIRNLSAAESGKSSQFPFLFRVGVLVLEVPVPQQ